MSKNTFRPLGDRVFLLFPPDEYRSNGGVLVKEGRRLDATVVGTGPLVSSCVGVGDRVVVDPDFHGTPVFVDGLELRSLSEDRLLAVIRH